MRSVNVGTFIRSSAPSRASATCLARSRSSTPNRIDTLQFHTGRHAASFARHFGGQFTSCLPVGGLTVNVYVYTTDYDFPGYTSVYNSGGQFQSATFTNVGSANTDGTRGFTLGPVGTLSSLDGLSLPSYPGCDPPVSYVEGYQITD